MSSYSSDEPLDDGNSVREDVQQLIDDNFEDLLMKDPTPNLDCGFHTDGLGKCTCPNPEAETGDELRDKFLMVQKLLKLPVHEDSSALQRMDGWEIADFIAAHTRRAVLLGKLEELKANGKYMVYGREEKRRNELEAELKEMK